MLHNSDFSNIYGQTIITNTILQKKPKDQPNLTQTIQMNDDFAVKRQSTFYDRSASNNYEKTPISIAFFSNQNQQIIQNAIREKVFQLSNRRFAIPPPNADFLYNIMSSVFHEFGIYDLQHPKEEIVRLNNIVVNKLSKHIYEQCISYNIYVSQIDKVVVPLDLPKQSGDRDFKQMDLTNNLFL
jgi:hypothetical protein